MHNHVGVSHNREEADSAEEAVLGVRYSFAAKFLLVSLFATLLLIGLASTVHLLKEWETIHQDRKWLYLASNIASMLFVSLVIATTCFRGKAVRKASGIQPRISAFLGSFLSLSLMFFPKPELPQALTVLALVMMIGGTLLSFCVLLWLGTSFSIMAEARRLVTNGPYAVVRHPLYACEQIAIFGALILHLSPLAVAVIALQFALQFKRMANEEKVLRQAFPEYAKYAAGVPRLIPFRFPA
ncbi:MAG TPA: isoprenylcysteine carboxylmethyltransferase family protein [Roseomonas sp.]|jgi:protein-S-isoprenylcysteine O-methyltransferase Ste14